MIGMPAEDRQAAIDLLHQQSWDKLVREGHGAEGDDFIGLIFNALIEPVRSADDVSERALPAVAEALHQLGKTRAVDAFALFIERDQRAFRSK